MIRRVVGDEQNLAAVTGVITDFNTDEDVPVETADTYASSWRVTRRRWRARRGRLNRARV